MSARTRPVWIDETPPAPPVSLDQLRRETAQLIRCYLDNAATDDHRTQIVNLADLLRHAMRAAEAAAAEIEHFAAEARDALAERDALQDQVAELEDGEFSWLT